MRLLNDDSDEKLDNISIFLTKEEALQLKSYLVQMLENKTMHHAHLNSSDFKKEVTVCIYDEDKMPSLHPRVIKLLQEDA